MAFTAAGVGRATHSTDEKPIARCRAAIRNDLPAREPRLRIEHQLGRGRRNCSHRSGDALIIIRPDAIGFSRSPRNEIQLGRRIRRPHERACRVDIIPVIGRPPGLIHPVAGGGRIHSTLRSAQGVRVRQQSPAIRRSSVPAVLRRTYTRIGSWRACRSDRVSGRLRTARRSCGHGNRASFPRCVRRWAA